MCGTCVRNPVLRGHVVRVPVLRGNGCDVYILYVVHYKQLPGDDGVVTCCFVRTDEGLHECHEGKTWGVPLHRRLQILHGKHPACVIRMSRVALFSSLYS